MLGYKLPDDFLIGTGSSAFQIEGATDRDGRTPSIMDYYGKKYANQTLTVGGKDNVYDDDVYDTAAFFYDNYEAYIEDMKKTGQNTFRMSVAWPRIIPDGTGEVNPKGIEFYNKVLDKLHECGITVLLDLLHWDLPMAIEDRGGYAADEFPEWYEHFARVCFENFAGERVAMWSTFNEACVSVWEGYGSSTFAPHYNDVKKGLKGVHMVNIAHFRAIKAFREMGCPGKIGTVNNINNFNPARLNKEDMDAAFFSTNNRFDIFTEPQIKGQYPKELFYGEPNLAQYMPEGFEEALQKWFEPMDFLGVNYYTTRRVIYDPEAKYKFKILPGYHVLEGGKTGVGFDPYPAGLLDILIYIKERYDNPYVLITENGLPSKDIGNKEIECDDEYRISYIREHLRMVARAIALGVNVHGYYYWIDADALEWRTSNQLRFGLTWVDRKTGERCWKNSRYFFSDICKTHQIY